MPQMPVEPPETFSSLVEGLVADCERIARQRERALRDEIVQLRRENNELRKSSGEASKLPLPSLQPLPDVAAKLPLPPLPDTAEKGNGNLASYKRMEQNEASSIIPISEANKGVFDPGTDVFAAMTGNMKLPDDYWNSSPLRDITDHLVQEDSGILEHVNRSCLLDPSSHTKLTWDVIGIPVLAWDLITIPMQVFDIGDTPVMLFMGWVTLIYWTLDIPMTFSTGFFDDIDGSLVMEFKRIVRNYMHGFFFLDFIIIGADWFSIGIGMAGSSAPPFLANLGVLRVLRISRFVRLMRLRKLKAKWQAIEDSIDNEWLLVCFTLFAKCCSIVGLNHYIGCAFFLIGDQEIPGYDNWLTAHRYPQFGDGSTSITDAPWGYKYLLSLHWAITQFTPGSMHVQPQNIPERLFTIWCLLFGMVVFSGFIASVTQARMQLNKLMSKFERDLWLLRKYCRQNCVSNSLTLRMRRYVDIVLIPKFHNMKAKDVVILPLLSQDLREELHTELETHKLRQHPFFHQLEEQGKNHWNKCVMKKICITSVENCPLAKGDVVFSCGEVAKKMYILLSSRLLYLPFESGRTVTEVEEGEYISEVCLWHTWTHQGQLQVPEEATTINILADPFTAALKSNGLVHAFARAYSKAFLDSLNADFAATGIPPSDLQGSVTKKIDTKLLTSMHHNAGESLK
jgi:hypothetical protein